VILVEFKVIYVWIALSKGEFVLRM